MPVPSSCLRPLRPLARLLSLACRGGIVVVRLPMVAVGCRQAPPACRCRQPPLACRWLSSGSPCLSLRPRSVLAETRPAPPFCARRLVRSPGAGNRSHTAACAGQDGARAVPHLGPSGSHAAEGSGRAARALRPRAIPTPAGASRVLPPRFAHPPTAGTSSCARTPASSGVAPSASARPAGPACCAARAACAR